MEHYYVNNNPTLNPGYHHEVHTEKHINELKVISKSYLGYYTNCAEAVNKAKEIYNDADGCAVCCPLCHRG